MEGLKEAEHDPGGMAGELVYTSAICRALVQMSPGVGS